jgi:hypothetical protein
VTAPNEVPPGATAPAPVEQVVEQAATTALAADAVAPDWFIPRATQENYAQIARDQAAIRGVEPRAVMQELAGSFEEQHQRNPLDGYDHLAAWARDFDPGLGQGPTGLAVLQARVIESARRDPYQAVIGDQAAVEQGVAAQAAYDAAIGTAAAAPSVDPASGFLPASGPLTIPPEVTVGPEGAEVMQGEPSPGVETPEGAADAPSPSSGTSSPSPADTGSGTSSTTGGDTTTTTTTETTSGGGKGGKGGSGSGSDAGSS